MIRDDFTIMPDFEELEYNLESIGIPDLLVVLEYDIIYFYSGSSNFYYEVNIEFIDRVLNNEHIILKDDMTVISFTRDQLDIIKNIFKDKINDDYKQRLIRGI